MMNTIEETINMAGFGKKKAMAKQIQVFEDKLSNEGESLLGVCASTKGTTQLYVTDKRIILHEIKGFVSNNEKSIPLDNINSININKNFVYASIEIITSGNTAIIEDVPVGIAEEIKAIIEHLKTQDTKPTHHETQVVGTIDISEQLIKLKELVDMGILTQEEFDAKKKQLLNI